MGIIDTHHQIGEKAETILFHIVDTDIILGQIEDLIVPAVTGAILDPHQIIEAIQGLLHIEDIPGPTPDPFPGQGHGQDHHLQEAGHTSDARHTTGARKRPVPYYRPSPSPSFSDSDSSYHSRRSRSRSHASRSRFRSLSRSPSLELYHRRRKHQQQHPVHHHQQHPQQLYQHIAQPLPPPPPSSSSSSLANPALSSVYPTTCLISQS